MKPLKTCVKIDHIRAKNSLWNVLCVSEFTSIMTLHIFWSYMLWLWTSRNNFFFARLSWNHAT